MKYPIGTRVTRPWKGKLLSATITEWNEERKQYTLLFHGNNTEHAWYEKSLEREFNIPKPISFPEDLFTI